MRKEEKREIENFIELLKEAHEEIRTQTENGNYEEAMSLLVQCQEGAAEAGELIEKTEGESFVTIPRLEEYCETVYEIYEILIEDGEVNANRLYKRLKKSLIQVENSVRNDIKARPEIVFLPYKASMWDSFESVWEAAKADPDCDVYVVPIPYYNRNSDGSLGAYHYEGNDLPVCVPIVNYEEYHLEERKPDAVFIHNPYDDMNYVTSIEPRFYSNELKKYTKCLVYIPYYATSGGMSESQKLCPAYLHADYIVIQAEKFRKYFDESIPDEKFLVFGSPKFDSVIHKCQNPPEPPVEWKEKMKGRKVYFYNTSINGMLADTECFLKKMRYVFTTFKGKENACLLWRPHPLLESTFDSMRKEYKPAYEALKKQFLEEQIGIYDTTPDMENTIALSDVYIGDNASSVVSLFGIVGKPLFLLNHTLDEKPGEEDWKGTVYTVPRGDRQDQYCILPGSRLYYSPNHDFHYEYYCDLSEYAASEYYSGAIEYEERVYIAPSNAQHFLVVEKDKQIRKIELKRETEQPGAFHGFWFWKDKIYLLPYVYKDLVVLDLKTEKISYISGVRDFNIGLLDGEKVSAAKWIWREKLYFLNPSGDKVLIMDIETYKAEIKDVPFHRLLLGVQGMEKKYDTVWFIPYSGSVITQWNPVTGKIKDYDVKIEGMTSFHRGYKMECDCNMIGSIGFDGDKLIIAPNWGNKFVELNIATGEVKEWIPPFPVSVDDKNKYFQNWGMGYFIKDMFHFNHRFFYAPERKTYDIDLQTKEIKEVDISFDKDEVFRHVPGFSKWSEWTQYMCAEDVFNSLEDFINNNIHGQPFDREKQIEAFAAINASINGDCGEKVYRFVSEKINDKSNYIRNL